jgi:hypothetical protein
VTITSDTRPVERAIVSLPEPAPEPAEPRSDWLSTVDIRTRPTVLGAIVVVALVVVGLAVFVGRDDAGRRPGFSPKDAVTSFLTAARDADVPAARNAVCAGMSESDTNSVVLSLMSQLKDFHVQRTTAHGDQADVDLTLTDVDGDSSGVTVLATRQGGTWKICDLGGGTPLGAAAGS